MTGDCSERLCDGDGAFAQVDDDDDVPDDRSECTFDSCREGSPIHEPIAVGTARSLGDGGLCNAGGICVQCLIHADCPTEVCIDQVCQEPRCEDGVVDGVEGGIDRAALSAPGRSRNPRCARRARNDRR